MPLLFQRADALKYLQNFLTHNKARGMVAELALDTYLADTPAAQKILAGAWLISPNVSDFYKYRYAVFVLPQLCESEQALEKTAKSYEKDRGFQALATFLSSSGLGVILVGALATESTPNPNAIVWKNWVYVHQRLHPTAGAMPFAAWPGQRGRASKGTAWQADVMQRLETVPPEQLTALTLRQAFFYGYLKQQLRKPLGDPYDVDVFAVGFRGAVMPLEVKEKSPTDKGEFGLDAGRILMMLRLCLATDSNGLYLIREVDSSPSRNFVKWRYITLSNLIMGCSWNLQSGGAGMGGGATQTVMMAGALFDEFDAAVLSEDWLARYSSLQGAVKEVAQTFANELKTYL